MSKTPFDRPPDFINEKGVQWWHDKSSTQYGIGLGLLYVVVFLVELPNGVRERAIVGIVEGESTILYTSQNLDAIGAHLDMMAFAAREATP